MNEAFEKWLKKDGYILESDSLEELLKINSDIVDMFEAWKQSRIAMLKNIKKIFNKPRFARSVEADIRRYIDTELKKLEK